MLREHGGDSTPEGVVDPSRTGYLTAVDYCLMSASGGRPDMAK